MVTAAATGDVVEVILKLTVGAVECHHGHVEVVDHELVLVLIMQLLVHCWSAQNFLLKYRFKLSSVQECQPLNGNVFFMRQILYIQEHHVVDLGIVLLLGIITSPVEYQASGALRIPQLPQRVVSSPA